MYAQSCPTICDPVDCSPQGSSVCDISQASILEWVAIYFSRESSRPRDHLLHWQVDSFPLSHQGKPYIWIESSFSNQFSKCWRRYREKGILLHCWWECKLVQPLWRTVWRFVKKLEIELPYDPAIPLLSTHTEEIRIERDTCPQCSSQHCLQELGHGSNLDVHWQMNG